MFPQLLEQEQKENKLKNSNKEREIYLPFPHFFKI